MSSRSLDDLAPEVRPLVDAFLAAAAAAGLDLLVTCTLRSFDEQAALYAKGRDADGNVVDRKLVVTDARPGHSAHQYGLAIDVVPVLGGKLDWTGDDPAWKQAGALGQAAGLEWAGAPGFPFHEDPHFEHPNWRAIAGLDSVLMGGTATL